MPDLQRNGPHLTVLVIAPIGRDAQLLQSALAAAGVDADAVSGFDEALERIHHESPGALLIAEEVLTPANVDRLAAELDLQPAWSDLPVLILTVGGSATVLSRQREEDRLPLGSVTLLERPIRIATLTSSVRSALRSRSRQYQVRDTLIDRDLAVAARRESESRLLLALDTARLGTWEYTLPNGVLEASATCREQFDWPATGPLFTKDLDGRIHPEDLPGRLQKLHTAAETGSPYTAEYRVLWRDGSVHWISTQGRVVGRPARISDAAEVCISGITMDITDRVKAEAAIRNAEKLALVGRLSSSIAHEINNPLESVTNLLYLLEHSSLDNSQSDYVSMAQKELARVSHIASQTLAFNRRQHSFEEVRPAEILDSVLALYQGRMATSNIQIHRDYASKRCVLCLPGEIRQVFANLIANAFDATRRGGRILIRERQAVHPRTNVQGVRVTIADTGSGMDSAVKRHIFEPFHSTKGNNGTGLGLWISRGIVEKHDGSMRFSSSAARAHSGTVFSVFLPLAPGETPEAA